MNEASTTRARRLLERATAGIPERRDPVTHVADLPGRDAEVTDWPSWAPTEVVAALRSGGIDRPWTHQATGAAAAWEGSDVIVATGTASGKSLVYQLPVLSTLVTDTSSTALYLAPTKALGADQLGAVTALDLDGVRAASYDGDTPREERDWVRKHARWVFSNPDMLHRGILSGHARWAAFFRKLRYVVVDECHSYRGVFGSHVALLLRRLQRVARHYGAEPVFVLASATTAEPAEFAARLTGRPATAITEDTSPRGPRTVALWEPPLLDELTGENGAPVRRSAGAEAARILAELVIEGARTLAFVRSRHGAELTSLGAKRILAEVDPALEETVAAYRAGYLPEERRRLEADLMARRLLGVATTNALELGVDISGLDAAVLAGYPGTLASFWQQSGRAGRAGDDALVVFVARDDPLDTYLVHHPEALLDQPVETAVLDPDNPYVLAPQLACAAAEVPLKAGELQTFGGDEARAVLDSLVADGVLRRRPSGWYWTSRDRPQFDVDIRGSGGEQVAVVEAETSRLLGTVDPSSACTTVHPGAVYLHQGSSYVVDELDLDTGLALVHAEDPEWNTSPREVIDIEVLATQQKQHFGGVTVCLGDVAVSSRVVGYLRRLPSGEVLDQVALDLPEEELRTRAVWYTISDELFQSAPPTASEAGSDADGGDSSEASAGGADADGAGVGGAVVEGTSAGAAAGGAVHVVGTAAGDVGGVVGTAADGPAGEATSTDAGGDGARISASSGSGTGGDGDAAGRREAPGLGSARLPGALHAAEHAAIGLLPLFATCDRWDIGGVSTALHADTGEATVFVHDGHPGGAGFADRGFAALVPWLAATREAIVSCECPAGCPSCVQSPKCGNGNEPLDKAGAVTVLDIVLGALGRDGTHGHEVVQAADGAAAG
ncbi:DEAD/DEAH box helicase domain-containing protein [Prauserella sediminis]|uniref:DEAD/DEAH box helicase domain-containing protein n=1 Tax=Prauserella sediminis TaxID=577680 RepID=A0A839XTW4_9PSEU|nr:DEAD/DEAH box helicase [Prauserella sediminis]MBB3663285.1 DEAD/DEAH box helicase domain-containing protein [Prauserella sediminis]